MDYVSVILDDGSVIYIKNSENQESTSKEGPMQASLGAGFQKDIQFKEEIKKIGRFLCELRDGVIKEAELSKLSSIELEVGLEFNQSIGCLLAGSAIDAAVKVKMTWEKKL